jgi:hypothetical protein
MMKSQHLPWYALALAAVVVAAFALGMPASMLAVLLVAMACPLMMMIMMGGMHGDGMKSGTGDSENRKRER